jgi:hypothetical protein
MWIDRLDMIKTRVEIGVIIQKKTHKDNHNTYKIIDLKYSEIAFFDYNKQVHEFAAAVYIHVLLLIYTF